MPLISSPWNQTLIILQINFSLVVQSIFASRLFRIPHKFSIGLISGELPGQSSTRILWSAKHFSTIFAVRHGAWSCWKVSLFIPLWKKSSVQNVNILLFSHHSYNWFKCAGSSIAKKKHLEHFFIRVFNVLINMSTGYLLLWILPHIWNLFTLDHKMALVRKSNFFPVINPPVLMSTSAC